MFPSCRKDFLMMKPGRCCTWEVTLFKSSGLRLFFMVPRAWTDSYLPLNVSVPADITRVMIGRIELVTPAQRQGSAADRTDFDQ